MKAIREDILCETGEISNTVQIPVAAQVGIWCALALSTSYVGSSCISFFQHEHFSPLNQTINSIILLLVLGITETLYPLLLSKGKDLLQWRPCITVDIISWTQY